MYLDGFVKDGNIMVLGEKLPVNPRMFLHNCMKKLKITFFKGYKNDKPCPFPLNIFECCKVDSYLIHIKIKNDSGEVIKVPVGIDDLFESYNDYRVRIEWEEHEW